MRNNLWKIVDLRKRQIKEKRHLTNCHCPNPHPPEPFLRQRGKGLGENSSYSLYDKEEPDSGICGAQVIVNAEILHHSTKYSSADCNVEFFLHVGKIIAQRTNYIYSKMLDSSRPNCAHEPRARGAVEFPFRLIS